MAKRDITGNPKKGNRLIDQRHPQWLAMHALWIKWRMVYEGGQDFIDTFLQRYSKRERDDDFLDRKKITYNPNHAAAIVNMVRNALAAKLPEVVRTGHEIYKKIMEENVDTFNSSMSTFLATEVLPLLLSQGKRYIAIDSPSAVAGAESAADDDKNPPYLYAIDAEDVLNWTYADTRTFEAILIREVVDDVDEETKLVNGTQEQWRYMRMVPEGEIIEVKFNGVEETLTGPGVLVRVFRENDKKDEEDIRAPVLLPLEQIPVVELKLVDSLLKDIAEMQCTILNLTSSDVSFLHKGNFSLYTEMYDPTDVGLKPHGQAREVEDLDDDLDDDDQITTDNRPNVREGGTTRGIGYPMGADRPDYIAPPVDNTRLSMEKQTEIARNMRQMLDLSLVSMSTAAVEQSGKSKEADKVGEEAGLAYLASIIETGETQTANVIHDFLGKEDDVNVSYPKGFSLKTPEERERAVDKLRERRTAVRSPAAAKLIDKQIATLQLEEVSTPDELQAVFAEIEAQPFIDDDEQRQKAISLDIADKTLSRKTGSDLRGHEAGEFEIVLEEEAKLSAAMSGIPDVPDEDTDDDQDDTDDEETEDDTDDTDDTEETNDGEKDEEDEEEETEDDAEDDDAQE